VAASHQIKKVSWWHQSLVDWMLANPDKNQNDCAAHFTVTPSYLSVVLNSDAFKDYFNARRAEHNEEVSKSVIERVEELAGTALDVLNARIAAERETVGLSVVTDAAEMALKAMGFGAAKGGPGAGGNYTENNIIVLESASKDSLAEARATMRQLNGGQPAPALLDLKATFPHEESTAT
jgi:hypothetical protein